MRVVDGEETDDEMLWILKLVVYNSKGIQKEKMPLFFFLPFHFTVF